MKELVTETERELYEALEDIAKGLIKGGGPSLELSPHEFRAEMWSWSQKRARQAIEGLEPPP